MYIAKLAGDGMPVLIGAVFGGLGPVMCLVQSAFDFCHLFG